MKKLLAPFFLAVVFAVLATGCNSTNSITVGLGVELTGLTRGADGATQVTWRVVNPNVVAYLDEQGRKIASFDPLRGPRDLLLVSVSPATGAAPAGAFAVARELEASAPHWAATLSEVEVLGEGDFRLYLGALTFPLLVRAGTLKERLSELEKLLPRLSQRYAKLAFIDLRFDRRIIFQPAL